MEAKKRFKLYKSGKLWCYSAILFGSLFLAGAQTGLTAHADSLDNANQTTTAQVANRTSAAVSGHAANSTAAIQQSAVQDDNVLNSQTPENNAAQETPANAVPVDMTTTNNQVNANQGYLDSYSLSQNAQGQVVMHASGWQASGRSNNQRYRWAIVYDNTAHREVRRQAVTPVTRTDVQQAYPHVVNSLYSGFDLDLILPNNVATHSLSLVMRYSNDAVNGEGDNTSYWFGPLYLDQSNRAWLDNISSNATNNTVTVSGWHASNAAAGRPYHYIIAYDSTAHREIARQLVKADQARPDVAKTYATIFNAGQSGFSDTFNLTPAMVRNNIQFVSRWTNDPAGNGSAVDYWFAAVNHDNKGYLDAHNLSTGNLQVSGWHANDASIFAPHHFVIVYDQTAHQQVAVAQTPLEASSDVARAYRNIRTAGQACFSYNFGNLNLQPGHAYQIISRYSQVATGNGDNGTGSYVDYWYPAFNLDQAVQYSIDGFSRNGNNLTITGWMASNGQLNKRHAYVILLKGGREVARQEVSLTDRPDVARVYPNIYNSLHSGFNASFDLANAPAGNLQFVLRFSNSANGEGSYVNRFSGTYASNAGWFDRITNTGHSLQVSGWHASTDIAGRPYQYIIAVDPANGRELARWALTGNSINIARNDVAQKYGWMLNAGQSGFSADLSANYNNLRDHAFTLIHRFTNDANGNGSYVDYQSGVVDLTNYASRLTNAWANIIRYRAGNIGIAVYSQRTGQIYSYTNAPGHRWWMASTVKVTVLTELLHRTGGNLNGAEQNLATNMIRYSDNNATSTLVYNYFGGVGALGNVFRAEGMNESAPGTDGWGTTTTTPVDQVKLLADIYLGPKTNYLNQRSRDYIHYQMSHVSTAQDWGISAGTGRGHFYIKNGWIPFELMNINSIGFIPGGNNSGYAIAVYTDRGPSMNYSVDTIQQLARATKGILQG